MAWFTDATEWMKAVCKLPSPVHHHASKLRRTLSYTGGGETHTIPLMMLKDTGTALPEPLKESLRTPRRREHLAALIGGGDPPPPHQPGTLSFILDSCERPESTMNAPLIDGHRLLLEIARFAKEP